METLRSFLDQSQLIWKDSTAAGRLGIALLLVICVGAVVGVGVWSSQPNYMILASGLEPGKAGKVIDSLDASNISYQVKGSGSIILVDKRSWSRAKIAAGQLGIESVDSQLEEVSPWMDPFSQQDIYRRNLERQLETTIARFKNVESADVHLSIPEKQAFIRQSSAPAAAVILEIAYKAKFTESNASSIASLVASSVNGLTNDLVSISDTLGQQYATDASLGQLSKQEEFRVLRERELTQKAEMILAKFLGFGNASVAVTTDFTFPMGTKVSKEVDPESKVIVDEVVRNSLTSEGKQGAAGVPGTSSNVQNGANSGRGSKGVVSETEDLENKYEISSSSMTETIQTPVMTMMTVGVLVNKTTVEDEAQVVLPDVKKKIESLVSQAVGFREDKDLISVEFFDFVDVAPEEIPAAAIPWDQINQVMKNVSLGLAAIVALFIAMKALTKFQPGPVVGSEKAEASSQVNQLSEMVRENPEVFSKIIETWSSLESDSNDGLNSRAA